jgi:hypothetical protein
MQSEVLPTVVVPLKQTVPSAEKEERKMLRIRNFVIGFALTAITLFFGAEAFAQVGGVDVGLCWIREAGMGPVIDLAAAPVPCPSLEDGLARSSSYYFYTSSGCDTIYKIDIASGATVSNGVYPGANFQALAFVINADTTGSRQLYGLDIIGNQLIEFDPSSMTPTGITIPIAPGIGRRACSGGNGHVFVQVENAGFFAIWRYNTRAGTWGPNIPTPVGGTIMFDGISFRGGVHSGTQVTPGAGSDIWRFMFPGPWVHLGAGFPTLPFPLSALGAI